MCFIIKLDLIWSRSQLLSAALATDLCAVLAGKQTPFPLWLASCFSLSSISYVYRQSPAAESVNPADRSLWLPPQALKPISVWQFAAELLLNSLNFCFLLPLTIKQSRLLTRVRQVRSKGVAAGYRMLLWFIGLHMVHIKSCLSLFVSPKGQQRLWWGLFSLGVFFTSTGLNSHTK